MAKCPKTKNKLKGYDIYTTEKENNKKSLAYISKVKEKIDCEYAEITDLNEAYTLLKKAKQKVFIKEELSLGFVLGFIGFAIPYLIENSLGSCTKELAFTFDAVVSVVVRAIIISFVLSCLVIWVIKKLANSYKNTYRLFVLPYEIEVLERQIKKIESNNKSVQNERGLKNE